MKIDHVHFYTRDAARTKDWFIRNIGFRAIGNRRNQHTHTELIALNSAYFVISSPLNQTSPVAQYLAHHPSGVADVAFRVKNLKEIVNRSCNLGVRLLKNIQIWRSPQANFRFAQVEGWGNLQHTLIETSQNYDYCLPIEIEQHQASSYSQSQISNIDHIVLNVAQGKLDSAVKLYQNLFEFQIQQSFKIQTDNSGLISEALIDPAAEVQFNINEPTSDDSQIQEFIDLNGGSGIQHLALRSQDLIADIARIKQGELKFLHVPQSYYDRLQQLLPLSQQEIQKVSQQQILIDGDRAGSAQPHRLLPHCLLMQIFTQPIFEQPTFFLEFIERRQNAKGFGQGNFKALFEAVEREQNQRNLGTDKISSKINNDNILNH